MNQAINDILNHLTEMAMELSPSTIREISNQISQVTDGRNANNFNFSVTLQAAQMVKRLMKLWSQAPEITGHSLSFALLSAQHAANAAYSKEMADLIWTGPSTNAVPLRRTDQALYELILNSSSELLLVSFVVYKVDRLVEALNEAISRGVDLTIIMEVGQESGGKITFDSVDAMRTAVQGANLFYWPLDGRERDTEGRYGALHAKCAVGDRTTAIVSSANLTQYALELNMEMGILVKGGAIPMKIASHFDELIRRKVLIEITQ